MNHLCEGGDGLCPNEAEADGRCDEHHHEVEVVLMCTNLPRCQLGDGMHAAACPRAGYDDATKEGG